MIYFFCDNFYTRHTIGKALNAFTDGESRVIGTVKFTNVDATNRHYLSKAIELMKDASRGTWMLVRAFNKNPEYERLRNKHSSQQRRLSSNNILYPRLPKEALEPIPNDSPKYTRALTVLTQLTQATPQSAESTPIVLPLKPELDISNNSDDNTTIQSIKSNPNGYKVTWLSRGRRGLLLILSEAVFFIEQLPSSIQVSQVSSMKFPTPQDGKKSQHRTLLDVVLVKDIERGSPTHRFYALDILCIEGGRVWHKPWEQRWKFLNEGVVLPRKKEEAKQQQQQQQQQHGHIYAKEPIKLRAKEYFPMKKLAFVMKDVCAGVAHEANGIRVVPMGEYFGDKKKDSVMAVVWKRGGDVVDEKLVSLLS